MTVATSPTPDRAEEHAFLDTVEGEIAFFRAIMRARPVGMHRYFHVIAIRNAIIKETSRPIHIETIWEKLRQCYDLDALESIDLEADSYLVQKTGSTNSSSASIPIRSPSPSENLAAHPFFREEFSLPYEEFEPIISERRMRATASLPSSPAAGVGGSSPAPQSGSATAARGSTPLASTGRRAGPGGRRRKGATNTITKSSLSQKAGLLSGDSDSSALTQESGDEGDVPETPRESVITGTDAGTDDVEDEDVEMRDPSPAAQETASTRGGGRGRGKAGAGGRRGRGGATRGAAATTRGGSKKKKK
ncbi:chromatin modification-related protein EAF7-domain-containing protein [Panaeolus papilionaceus]|nr:chromatin modification-related protein EAF7-domain-containing protein [Panaeolus papilionaceus]